MHYGQMFREIGMDYVTLNIKKIKKREKILFEFTPNCFVLVQMCLSKTVGYFYSNLQMLLHCH